MSNPLTDAFTSAPVSPSTPLATRTSAFPTMMSSLNASFGPTSIDPSAAPPTWPTAMTRSALATHMHRVRSSIETTLTSIATHPLVTRAASHPAVVRLASKLNLPPHVVAALALCAALALTSLVVSGKRVLFALSALVPLTHSLRALESNNPTQLKSALKLWLLYSLTATRKPTYTHLLARLALLTYQPAKSAAVAYALVIRPLVAAAVAQGVVPRTVARSVLGMDPDQSAAHMVMQPRSPVDMHDVPEVVQRAVALVVAARPEIGKYLGVVAEAGEWAVPLLASEQGTQVHASPVARAIHVGDNPSMGEQQEGDEMSHVHHVRKTSDGGVLGLASVKLQQQLTGGGAKNGGLVGSLQQFVDAEDDGQEPVGRSRASGRLGM
ncbi:hypothetical protein BCR44DRAFT_1503118 [Catenaria anguillulae PL171]|uniref:Uncharacterized protein n=1 Tax=Catenaria anguillulae PL171 TaxID=765915 RepID=A0A1Y2H914_9FUNG|nr:hypothetical protein BCR44DRAFT_1503118 [Catenaria anguillulae PL171]